MSIDAAVQQLVQQTVQALIPQIVQAVAAQLPAAPPANAGFATAAPVAAAQPDPFGGLGAPAPQAVTAEMVQSLVMELVNHPTAGETYKAQLTAQMNAMGLTSLPDAKPEQIPELYQRFLAVKNGQQAAAPAQQFAAPAATGGVSII